MVKEAKLGVRQREILATVVRQYVSTGLPVGSKVVADLLEEGVSAATVRIAMGHLEKQGYLDQPHVSAGRVPTDKAYRLFVDGLPGGGKLELETEQYIKESLTGDPDRPEALMAKTSHVLAEVSQHVGVVLGPNFEDKILEHIKFVKLPGGRVLAVVVSRPDLVENKVIRVEEDFPQELLDRCADFLNEEFRGWSLRTIRLELFKRVEEMQAVTDRVLSTMATLFVGGRLGDEEPGPLFVEGAARMLDRPDFDDFRKVRDLLATLEEKAKLARLLSASLDTSGAGIRMVIGRENPHAEMHDCAVVVAPYHYRDRVVGVLGVVGPLRMEYERAIRTVDYVSNLCSRLLSSN
jgi:heat-inducible transcriptional repressor